ncbi:MAG: hypothetical protein OXL37_10420 [Chloroflexota bacterium]|nr:hypothetical protein [Chloroflexota bacterium]MDE2960563.1 hypothetical protein [Chloroflexota bacterium]
MKTRIKKITAVTAALALAIAISTGAYVGLNPQPASADADVAHNEFVNPDGGARVFIGTGGVRFGDAEDLSVYLYDSSNGDVPQKVTVSFAMPTDDETCKYYAMDYAWALRVFHNQPSRVAPDPHGELVLQHAGNGIYDMYGPASKDAQVRRVIGGDNEPECFANMAGLAVMLHDADGNLIHVWNPALQAGGKTAYVMSENGNPLFHECGYMKVERFAEEPPKSKRFSKIDGEWVQQDDGTHSTVCALPDDDDHQDLVDRGLIVDPFVDWTLPLAPEGYFLVSQQMHIQGR